MATEKNYAWLTAVRIAHRGLHDNKTIPENSLLAFSKAVEKGYGVEFDVYLSTDGKLIVYHDPTLLRSDGKKIKTVDIDTNHLEDYTLFNTSQHIPLLSDVLDLIDGKINIILEIKTTRFVEKTCQAIWDILKDYHGNFCIESFNPYIVRWWSKNHPEIILGQLYSAYPWIRIYSIVLRQYKIVDFLAVCLENVPSLYYKRLHKKYPKKVQIAWTVHTPKQQERAIKFCDNYIFETNAKNSQYILPPKVTN